MRIYKLDTVANINNTFENKLGYFVHLNLYYFASGMHKKKVTQGYARKKIGMNEEIMNLK